MPALVMRASAGYRFAEIADLREPLLRYGILAGEDHVAPVDGQQADVVLQPQEIAFRGDRGASQQALARKLAGMDARGRQRRDRRFPRSGREVRPYIGNDIRRQIHGKARQSWIMATRSRPARANAASRLQPSGMPMNLR